MSLCHFLVRELISLNSKGLSSSGTMSSMEPQTMSPSNHCIPDIGLTMSTLMVDDNYFFFYEWYINQWENREAFKIQKQEHGKICKYGDPGLWPAHCFSWEKMGPSLPQWAEMTSDCSYRLQHLLSPGPWKEVGEDLNTSKNFSKVKKALSIHFYTCLWCRNISHRGHSLHCSLATGEYLSFVLLPLSYPWHIWLNHFFSTSLIVGKFDQNSQLTLNSVLVMN